MPKIKNLIEIKVICFILLSVSSNLGATKFTRLNGQCFIPGACVNSTLIDETSVFDASDCHDFCLHFSDCSWFTFYTTFNICTAMADCTELTTIDVPAVSGERSCEEIECGIQGRCQGTLISVGSSSFQSSCISQCQSWNEESHSQRCEWYTYDEATNGCFLFSDCPLINEKCFTCVSGQSGCTSGKAMTKLLVGSGMPTSVSGDGFEIIDLGKPPLPDGGGNLSCNMISNFPYEIYGAVGAVIPGVENGLPSSPLICGGSSYKSHQLVLENSCYQIIADQMSMNQTWNASAGWEETTEMGDEGVTFASAVAIQDDGLLNEYVWWVTGGITDNQRILKTSLIRFLNGSWASGPQLEKPVYAHCTIQVLRHVTMIIGGTNPNESFSADVATFDWNTKTWARGSSLMEGRYGHACGQLRDLDQTGEYPSKIIVAGGMGSGQRHLSSVEIYDSQTSEWTTGPNLPTPRFGGVIVQFGPDEILYVGGGNDMEAYDTILSMTVTSMVWKELEHKMSTPRYAHVAFFVPDSVLTNSCTLLEEYLDDETLIEEFQLIDA